MLENHMWFDNCWINVLHINLNTTSLRAHCFEVGKAIIISMIIHISVGSSMK